MTPMQGEEDRQRTPTVPTNTYPEHTYSYLYPCRLSRHIKTSRSVCVTDGYRHEI